MAAKGRLQWFEGGPANVGYRQLARVPPADLQIPILGQLAPAQFRSAMLSNRVCWR
jgi:hypothetical protein